MNIDEMKKQLRDKTLVIMHPERDRIAAALESLQRELEEARRLQTTLTKNPNGELVAVTLTDEEHRIHKVLWERDHE